MVTTDGELFHVIDHGSWWATMEALLPRSPEEIRQEIEEDAFLSGAEAPPPAHSGH